MKLLIGCLHLTILVCVTSCDVYWSELDSGVQYMSFMRPRLKIWVRSHTRAQTRVLTIVVIKDSYFWDIITFEMLCGIEGLAVTDVLDNWVHTFSIQQKNIILRYLLQNQFVQIIIDSWGALISGVKSQLYLNLEKFRFRIKRGDNRTTLF